MEKSLYVKYSRCSKEIKYVGQCRNRKPAFKKYRVVHGWRFSDIWVCSLQSFRVVKIRSCFSNASKNKIWQSSCAFVFWFLYMSITITLNLVFKVLNIENGKCAWKTVSAFQLCATAQYTQLFFLTHQMFRSKSTLMWSNNHYH